jgi:hypothetical protein
MTTENEKVVRDLIYKAWAEWRKSPDALKLAQIVGYEDAVAFPRLFEAGYRAALQSQSNTDGWVMVPTMPTDTQLDRAVSFALNVQISGSYNWTMYMRDVYLRMLSAAPKAPQQVSNTPQDGGLPEQRDLLRVYVEHGFICVRTSDEKLIANHRIDALQPYQFFEIPGTATPPQQEQSGEAVAPIGYIRLQNGKVDWDENCLSATEGGTLFGYEGIDSYTESPVYLESGQRVGSAALHTLLEYCERAEDCQMGTLAIDLVQRLVNEALSTSPATPTATASQESATTSDQAGREPT